MVSMMERGRHCWEQDVCTYATDLLPHIHTHKHTNTYTQEAHTAKQMLAQKSTHILTMTLQI